MIINRKPSHCSVCQPFFKKPKFSDSRSRFWNSVKLLSLGALKLFLVIQIFYSVELVQDLMVHSFEVDQTTPLVVLYSPCTQAFVPPLCRDAPFKSFSVFVRYLQSELVYRQQTV